jgi:hypothetical protein
VTGLRSGIHPREELIVAELCKIRAAGPLASHVEGFCAALIRMGYTPRTARDHGHVLVHLSRWMVAERVEPAD